MDFFFIESCSSKIDLIWISYNCVYWAWDRKTC